MNLQAAPPGILDLIPWGPSPPPPHHEAATDLHPHIWSHLPENLLHSVLPCLPFQSVLRFRCVCKEWRALFASPTFHHFASHRAHVPPLIFFIGTCKFHTENGDAINHFDDGYDDNGYVYDDDDHVPDGSGYDESISADSDGDSHDDNVPEDDNHVPDGSGYDESISADSDRDSYDDYVPEDDDHVPDGSGSDESMSADSDGDTHDDYVPEDDDHVPDGGGSDESRSDDSDMSGVIRYEDLRDMHDFIGQDHGDVDDHVPDSSGSDESMSAASDGDNYDDYVPEDDDHVPDGSGSDESRSDDSDMSGVIRYEDLRDMHDFIGQDHGDDDHFSSGQANDQEAPKEHTNIEPLLLIFDCESESWRRPLALPPGFRMTLRYSKDPMSFRYSFLARDHVCTFQEQLLIPTSSSAHFFLFNPASPPSKKLPPCIAIQRLQSFGFVEERATLPGAFTLSNNLLSMSNEKELRVQDKNEKFLQVVAVGDTVNDIKIVESFDSVTGSWHVIGRMPLSQRRLPRWDLVIEQMRMIYCKGCFYVVLWNGILMMSNVRVGQNMEWKFREFPEPPNPDGGERELDTQSLVATRESVFLVGVVVDRVKAEDQDVLIWQYHPHAPANACWELHAYVPSGILDTFIDNRLWSWTYSAHGDLIFFNIPGRQRFLIYDVPQKLWRFSAKCKYSLDTVTFVWEPLLRN